MIASIVVHRPARALQLFVLFHGGDEDVAALAPLGRNLASAFPEGFVVVLPAPAGMPEFLAAIAHWQSEAGVPAQATAIVGFAKGAMLALEATKSIPVPAGRVLALAGRFEALPTEPAPETTVHLFHGKEDPVIPYAGTIDAAQRLLELGTDVTADVIPFLGHEVSGEMVALVLERLRGYLPQRYWREALAVDPADSPGPDRATRAPH
jgi:phospholipase/carboxylesterase